MAEAAPQPAAKWGDLGVRVTSSAVLVPAVLLDVWAGGIWFNLFIALLGVLMAQEWTAICHRQSAAQFALHAAGAMCGALLPPQAGLPAAMLAIAILWALSAAIAYAEDSNGAAWRYLGVPYVGVPAIALVLLRADTAWGAYAIVWVMLIVWLADSLAYFSGRIIGGPKLAPVLSPKKTWAGLGGAIAGSAIASTIFAVAAGLPNLLALAVLAGLLAVVEQAGDLFKSAMKRHHGVKDTGRLIPGHGGIIDRVDGLVAVATAAAIAGGLRGGFDATGAGLLLW